MLISRELIGRVACAWSLLTGCSRELPLERAVVSREQPPASVASPGGASSGVAQHATSRTSGVAVVELFTSEGCSSCPPADRVLASLAARAKSQSLLVFPLSFHVDYWNYLGWRDSFSDARYSERQRGYSAIGTGGGTYTPQVVVNGEDESVGSNASRIESLVEAALKRAPRSQIELEARRAEYGIEVSYRVTGETRGRVLNLALVEPRAESQVESGENAGERLAHVNIVRVFSSRPLSQGTAGQWSPPAGPAFEARKVSVVAFVEGASQRDISGAVALELP